MIYFDKIIHFFFKSKHNFSNNVVLKEYIITEFTLRDNKTLCVLCPPWHIGKFATSFLRKRLKEKNYSFLTYDIHPDVFSADYKNTKKYILNIITKIDEDINYYKKKYQFKEIIIIGISLGCLYAINVSIRNKNINKIIFVSPGYSLEENLWTGYTTQELKNTIVENNNVTFNDLKEEWKELSPYHNIHKLKEKNIILLSSKKDCITKYKSVLKLMDKFNKHKIIFKKEINKHLGHYGTIAKFLLFPKKYI